MKILKLTILLLVLFVCAFLAHAYAGPPRVEYNVLKVEVHIHIDSGIEYNYSHWTEVFHAFENAPKETKIHMWMNSPGGAVAIGMELADRIKSTKADVFFHAVGNNYSMSALLMCLAKPGKFTAHSNWGTVMFHDMQVQLPAGSINDLMKQLEALRSFTYEFYHALCHGVLTDKEIEAINNGKDLYINVKDFEKRINNQGS